MLVFESVLFAKQCNDVAVLRLLCDSRFRQLVLLLFVLLFACFFLLFERSSRVNIKLFRKLRLTVDYCVRLRWKKMDWPTVFNIMLLRVEVLTSLSSRLCARACVLFLCVQSNHGQVPQGEEGRYRPVGPLCWQEGRHRQELRRWVSVCDLCDCASVLRDFLSRSRMCCVCV